ncbi:hypothetical protein [Rhodococcus qingshengii]|uniref:hypothetical protein n=1 Tax=Rhodococcus qingshengii TaxID=334542 RepID=UPI0035E10CE5
MRSAGIRYHKLVHPDGTLTEKLRISVGLLNPEIKKITLCVPEKHHHAICEAQINFSPFRYRSVLLQNSINLRAPESRENLPALMMTMTSQEWEWTVSVPDEMVCITHSKTRY